MPSLMEDLIANLDAGTLEQMGKQAGIDSSNISGAVQAALPAILSGLNKNTAQSGGADALSRALQKDHDGSILDNLGGLLNNPELMGQGQKILGHIFGAKQDNLSRGLGQATSVPSDSMGQLMAMLAPMVMGMLGKQQRQGAVDSGSLSDMLGQEQQKMASAQPQTMNILNSMLDADGDGDVDVADLLSKAPDLLGGLFGRK